MAKAKKTLAKSSFVETTLDTALEKLAVAEAAVDKSVSARAGDAKKLTATVKRLTKRKAALVKRKKLAADRVRKAPSGETRQALKVVVKDLAATSKELTKLRVVKAENAAELALLKVAQRRTKAFSKGIAQVERALAKKK
jgi:hypothetical protein